MEDEDDFDPSHYLRRSYNKTRGKQNNEDEFYKSSNHYQLHAWKQLQNALYNCVMKLNHGNVTMTKIKLYKLNIVRGKGMLCRFLMFAQINSLKNTFYYATLVALINVDFPNVIELLITRCILQFKVTYFFEEIKTYIYGPVYFLSHLVNYCCVDDNVIIEMLKILINSPTEDSLQLVWIILKICGRKVSIKKKVEMDEILKNMDNISNDFQIDIKIRYLMKDILTKHTNGFKIEWKYDMVLLSKQQTHDITLSSAVDPRYDLDFYILDLDYLANEELFKCSVPRETDGFCYDSDADDEEESDDEFDVAYRRLH